LRKNAFLLSELVRRELTARFAGSLGGPLWMILNPLVYAVIFGYVFSVVLKTSPPPGFPAGYAEFLLAGLLPWIGVQEAVSRGGAAVLEQGHLVKKLRFPSELLVAAAVGTALLTEAVAVALLTAYAAASGADVRPGALAAAFLLQALALAGPVLLLAALEVYVRDAAQLVAPALMILFYLTPIVYPETMVPAGLRPWLQLNPLKDIVALFRAGIFGSPWPDAVHLAGWSAFFLVLAFAARKVFRRASRSFADLL